MKLRYSPKAIEDLQNISRYIVEEFYNPSAANRVTSNIIKSCSYLKAQPYMGFELSRKTERKTDLRCLVAGHHLVFYKVDENHVAVMRILDARTDYMKVLFDNGFES